MMKYLFSQNLADVNARTLKENQTPIHYAAKYNATDSLMVLIEFDARLDDRDHKERTPLQLGAETGMKFLFTIKNTSQTV